MSGWLHSRRACVALAMLGGFLTGLTLIVPQALGWLEWASPALAVPMLWRLAEEGAERKRYLRAWRGGFLFFLPFYLVVFHWFLALYPLSFAGISPWLAVGVVALAWGGLALFQSVGMAFCFVVIVLLWRVPFCAKHRWLRPLIAGAAFTVGEWLQTLGWFGVPWGRFALGQAAYLPLVQTASIFGCYGITFLVITVGFFVGQAVCTEKIGRRSLCALAGGLFVGNLLLGSILLAVGDAREAEHTLRAGTVQGNFSTASKWDMTISETVDLYMEHMYRLAEEGTDFILLPETALPFFLQDYEIYQDRIRTLTQTEDVTVFTGAFTYDASGEEYSSVLTYHTDGMVDDKVYHKRRPVPFGEFVPWRRLVTALIPPLADLNLWASDLSAGREAAVVTTEGGRYGFLICFDSIYESLARESVKNGAQILLLPTNDSWFLDSAAVHMHHNQARLRAVECGRSIVRAANTGISSVITPTGRVTARLEPLVEGSLRAEAALYSHTTPYVLLGNWFIWGCFALLLLPVADKIRYLIRMRLDKIRPE